MEREVGDTENGNEARYREDSSLHFGFDEDAEGSLELDDLMSVTDRDVCVPGDHAARGLVREVHDRDRAQLAPERVAGSGGAPDSGCERPAPVRAAGGPERSRRVAPAEGVHVRCHHAVPLARRAVRLRFSDECPNIAWCIPVPLPSPAPC